MKLIKVPEDKEEMLEEFCNASMFTFEGIDIHSENGKRGLMMFEEQARNFGYDKPEMIGYYFSGKFMNKAYGYTGSNAYKDDLTFLVIPYFYNPVFKLQCGARWFDDIVANNSIRQNAEKTGMEPDYT